MQVYHGTGVRSLPDIAEFGGLFCTLDLSVKRILRMQREMDYDLEKLSESELERGMWDDAIRRKNRDRGYKFDDDIYVFVDADEYHPDIAISRCGTLDVILGFDIDPSRLIGGIKIFRNLPLISMNRIVSLEKTNLEEVRRIMHSYTVPYFFYNHNSGKLIPLEEQQATVSPRGV